MQIKTIIFVLLAILMTSCGTEFDTDLVEPETEFSQEGLRDLEGRDGQCVEEPHECVQKGKEKNRPIKKYTTCMFCCWGRGDESQCMEACGIAFDPFRGMAEISISQNSGY
jgi:hypothetical protein